MNCIIDAWEKHESELRGFINKHIVDVHHSEDLLQETFIKAIRQGTKFCNLENPRAWLYRVTRNQLIDHQRRHKNYDEIDENISYEEIEIPAIETLSACLPKALEALNKHDREALIACDIDGMSQIAFAQKTGLGLSATKSRIRRARKKLKEKLNSLCNIKYDETGNVCSYLPSKNCCEN